MAAAKPCSKLQAFFVLEGRRMLAEAVAASLRPGDKLEAQVAGAAIALKLPFDVCWRVHCGRCGARAFLRLYAQYRTWAATREREAKAADLAARLDRLERTIGELVDRLETLPGDGAALARRDVGGGRPPSRRSQPLVRQDGAAPRPA